jgi:hypothetical protein
VREFLQVPVIHKVATIWDSTPACRHCQHLVKANASRKNKKCEKQFQIQATRVQDSCNPGLLQSLKATSHPTHLRLSIQSNNSIAGHPLVSACLK